MNEFFYSSISTLSRFLLPQERRYIKKKRGVRLTHRKMSFLAGIRARVYVCVNIFICFKYATFRAVY